MNYYPLESTADTTIHRILISSGLFRVASRQAPQPLAPVDAVHFIDLRLKHHDRLDLGFHAWDSSPMHIGLTSTRTIKIQAHLMSSIGIKTRLLLAWSPRLPADRMRHPQPENPCVLPSHELGKPILPSTATRTSDSSNHHTRDCTMTQHTASLCHKYAVGRCGMTVTDLNVDFVDARLSGTTLQRGQ